MDIKKLASLSLLLGALTGCNSNNDEEVRHAIYTVMNGYLNKAEVCVQVSDDECLKMGHTNQSGRIQIPVEYLGSTIRAKAVAGVTSDKNATGFIGSSYDLLSTGNGTVINPFTTLAAKDDSLDIAQVALDLELHEALVSGDYEASDSEDSPRASLLARTITSQLALLPETDAYSLINIANDYIQNHLMDEDLSKLNLVIEEGKVVGSAPRTKSLRNFFGQVDGHNTYSVSLNSCALNADECEDNTVQRVSINNNIIPDFFWNLIPDEAWEQAGVNPDLFDRMSFIARENRQKNNFLGFASWSYDNTISNKDILEHPEIRDRLPEDLLGLLESLLPLYPETSIYEPYVFIGNTKTSFKIVLGADTPIPLAMNNGIYIYLSDDLAIEAPVFSKGITVHSQHDFTKPRLNNDRAWAWNEEDVLGQDWFIIEDASDTAIPEPIITEASFDSGSVTFKQDNGHVGEGVWKIHGTNHALEINNLSIPEFDGITLKRMPGNNDVVLVRDISNDTNRNQVPRDDHKPRLLIMVKERTLADAIVKNWHNAINI